jgi:hypothetical protein
VDEEKTNTLGLTPDHSQVGGTTPSDLDIVPGLPTLVRKSELFGGQFLLRQAGRHSPIWLDNS